MEHLPVQTGSCLINIPYVGSVEFETDGDSGPDGALSNFKGSWMRQGWNVNRATGGLVFDDWSPQEIIRALQTTLYFGCLISVFRRVGITVRTRDFLDSPTAAHTDNTTFVRTTKLHGFIAEWTRREGFADGSVVQDANDPKTTRGFNIHEMLNWTFWYLTKFCEHSDGMPAPYRDQAKLIELSIMAMGESLCSVVVAVYGGEHRNMPIWGPSPVLKTRLKDNGWCPSDSPFFPESIARANVSADHYFGSFRCPSRRADHGTCSTAICNAYLKVVIPGEYEQKHVLERGCPCVPARVSDDIISIVARGEIPVIQWDGDSLKVSVRGAQSKYVAISHVWSDGLGNDEAANSMLRCQLSRVQSLVNRLYPEIKDENVPFWIDTLCVPVDEAHRELRKRVIRHMSEIYRVADRVLVLDSFILQLSRSASIVDKYIRIHLSNWHHRLWTMQEGQMASALFFQFCDGAQSFLDMRGAEPQALLDTRDPRNLCSPIWLLCSDALETFYRYRERHARVDVEGRLRSCALYLRSRQTSRLEDEPVCVASLLGLDPSPILESKDGAERMASFYDLVGRFDPRIIFHEHPRLQKPGYRWAPRSFLHQIPDLITMREDLNASTSTRIVPRGGGLPVQFAGVEFYSPVPLQAGSCVYFRQYTHGAVWAQPQQEWSWAARTPWWTCTYKLEVLEEEGIARAPAGQNGVRYSVIILAHFTPDELPQTAVMSVIDPASPPVPSMAWQGPWTAWTTGGNPGTQTPAYATSWQIPMDYACRVRVSLALQGEVPCDAPIISAWAYSQQQQWLVR
ncbi:hypothetical protein F5Y14DRAFT_198927 [Nemania sp. NC0429]|nr:hypothetical protein F5Y14DRAFT_198927 [Nemania sp. NC0429]